MTPSRPVTSSPLRVLMLSLHGLVRGHDPELGRDPDTGGQVSYVVELARALGRRPDVDRVLLLTRLIDDPAVDPCYAVPEEPLGPKASIVRLPFGPRRYLRKETLWPYLESLALQCLEQLEHGRWEVPNVVHGHYADAGWVGLRIARALGARFVHTGHSLGRQKQKRLLESGRSEAALERQFAFSRRIAAEEETFAAADLVIASTEQERDGQWGAYDAFDPSRVAVIPPGIDHARFGSGGAPAGAPWVDRYLARPELPLVLAIARPAPKKNLGLLVEAFGADAELRRTSNLCIVAGTREDVRSADEDAREVLTELLVLADKWDLHGSLALPKTHTAADVPALYRLAAARRGVFVNPALTEPFGLTLLEAASSGLPVVATRNGGAREIVENCGNGLLVDPRDPKEIAAALRAALSDARRWDRWAESGRAGVLRRYTWERHAEAYVARCRALDAPGPATRRVRRSRRAPSWLLFSDLDDTLLGDAAALRRLVRWIESRRDTIAFGVATGRVHDDARAALAAWDAPLPDVFVTGVGTEVGWEPDGTRDAAWQRHVASGWNPSAVDRALREVRGLVPQPTAEQTPFKRSWYLEPAGSDAVRVVRRRLRAAGLRARVVVSRGRCLDVIPLRASKGHAIRYVARRAGVPLERVLVAGDSGNDIDMLASRALAVVVGNHTGELRALAGRRGVYFARAAHADGILEGIARWRFGEAEAAAPAARESA